MPCHSSTLSEERRGLHTFRNAVEGDSFAVCAELTIGKESTADDIRRQADCLAGLVDGIQVTDNPYAWVQMSALAASTILVEHGFDPVPIMTCRDRNRRALHSDLMGLKAVGVDNVVLIRGHRVPKDHSVPASTVFDLTGPELIALAASLEGELFIGTGARLFRPGPRWQAESLFRRAEAGARFLQTQFCFNMEILTRYMKRFTAAGLDRHYAIMVSLSPLPSATTARWVKKHLSDSRIPAEVMQRLEDAADPVQEGIEICAELMQQISEVPGVSGVNLMTTGDPSALRETISLSGLRD
jgi:methylenetetrahydrofolate reductase (NADPH)